MNCNHCLFSLQRARFYKVSLVSILSMVRGIYWALWGVLLGSAMGNVCGYGVGPYGVRRGLWDCGVAPMGKSMGMAMGLDLWASMGLRCGTYGAE